MLDSLKSPDDCRCFIVPFDVKLDANNQITGFDASPGNKKIVHHIVVCLVLAGIGPFLDKPDQEKPGLGYDCFGAPRFSK